MPTRRQPEGIKKIERAIPEQADHLTRIAIASKAHWGYDQEFMERFAAVIAITPDYVRQNEVWILEEAGKSAGFYALIRRGEMGELDHLWLLPQHIGKGLGRLLFDNAYRGAPATSACGNSSGRPSRTRSGSTSGWEAAPFARRWASSAAACR